MPHVHRPPEEQQRSGRHRRAVADENPRRLHLFVKHQKRVRRRPFPGLPEPRVQRPGVHSNLTFAVAPPRTARGRVRLERGDVRVQPRAQHGFDHGRSTGVGVPRRVRRVRPTPRGVRPCVRPAGPTPTTPGVACYEPGVREERGVLAPHLRDLSKRLGVEAVGGGVAGGGGAGVDAGRQLCVAPRAGPPVVGGGVHEVVALFPGGDGGDGRGGLSGFSGGVLRGGRGERPASGGAGIPARFAARERRLVGEARGYRERR